MKKFIIVFLSICFSLANFSFAEDTFPFVGESTVDNLNIRAGYHTDFETIYKLKNKDKLIVIDRKNNWYNVELPSEATCFINSKYIGKNSEGVSVVIADRVNVRARPNLKANVLCQLNKNDAVNIAERPNQEWCKIKAPTNCRGWVYDKYLKYYSSVEEYNKEKEQELAKFLDKSENQANISLNKKTDKSSLKSVEKFEFEQTGTIKRVKSFFKQPYSHTLSEDGKIISYLKGDKSTLSSFVNLKVKVSGNLEKDSNYKYPLVIVEKISIIE